MTDANPELIVGPQTAPPYNPVETEQELDGALTDDSFSIRDNTNV